MRLIIVILLNFIFFKVQAQSSQRICLDTIEFETTADSFFLKLQSKVTKFDFKSLKEIQVNFGIEVNCTSTGFDLYYTLQNGNEYQVFHNLFEKVGNEYFLTKHYNITSNRNEYALSGFCCRKLPINKFDFNKDYLIDNKTEREIYSVSGLQEKEPTEKLSYYKLIKNTWKRKDYKSISLFTDEFVITELKIVDEESIDHLNDIAFYAYNAKSYASSIFLLNKVLEKSPGRVVAYLNIADCYWDTNDKAKAVANYQKYYHLMKEQKKDINKIPKYVLERLK